MRLERQPAQSALFSPADPTCLGASPLAGTRFLASFAEGHLLIVWVCQVSACVARDHVDHAIKLLKVRLSAPETSHCEDRSGTIFAQVFIGNNLATCSRLIGFDRRRGAAKREECKDGA